MRHSIIPNFACSPSLLLCVSQSHLHHSRFLLDLTKEQEEGFAESVAAIGVQAGFVPAQGEESDVFATFARQEE